MRYNRPTRILVAAALVAVAGVAQADAATSPTPDDACREYLAGVAAADVGRILGASAIDEMSTGFRFDLYVDRLRTFLPFTLAPADDPFHVETNRAQQTALILRQAQILTYSLLSGETIDGTPIAPVDLAWATAFAERVDPARLADLEVLAIRFPDASMEQDARWLKNAAASAAMYGADEQTERLVLFSLEGQTWVVGFQLLRYGEGWKVSSQISNLAGTSVLGTATPMTAEEYDATTSGEG